jgi:hypothetical protein
MKNMKKSIFLALFVLFLIPLGAKAQNEFNPSMLISDYDLLNFKSMSKDQIQKFLESKNSYLATYKTLNAYGQERMASEIIYDAAVNNYDCAGAKLSDTPTEEERKLKCQTIGTVNPQFLIVLLQKEQSLIESRTPREGQLDWATGYGCPDASACNPYFKGFGKQVNSAALQFRWYMLNPNSYNFKAGQTYTFRNQYGTINTATMEVTIENKATAALYNYTPHVYNGNYNFWAIWNRYFPTQGYPNGTILKVNNDYWLIQHGQKRKFASVSVLASRFDPARAISVGESDLSAYDEGAPIKFHNYAIIMSPEGKLYLLVDDKKRLFSSTATFKQLGFNIEEIQNASWQDINSYLNGKDITVASAYPTGALLQNKKTGGVYFVIEETKAPIIDKIFLNTKFKGKTIIPVEESELNTYTTVSPVRFDDGELIKSQGTPAVYLIQDGQKRAFSTGEIFEELGYQWSNIITVPEKVLGLYQNGELIQ